VANHANSAAGDLQHRTRLLCALGFERDELARHLPSDVPIEVCGPGAGGIDRWFGTRADRIGPVRGIVLVGTAGGLAPDLEAGVAMVADRILDLHGRTWTPTLPTSPSARRGAILSVEQAATSPAEKARHRAASGADAVDLESATFAEACEARGWRWAVVRGISDGANDRLPDDVSTWIDDRGGLRSVALLRSLARTPRTLAQLPALRRRSRRALRAVALATPTTTSLGIARPPSDRESEAVR